LPVGLNFPRPAARRYGSHRLTANADELLRDFGTPNPR
jgi:hypothetical protein